MIAQLAASLLVNAICVWGLWRALRTGSRATHFGWAFLGLGLTLDLGILAWVFYRVVLAEAHLACESITSHRAGEVLITGIQLAQVHLTTGLLGLVLPLLLSLGLLTRGLLLPAPEPTAPQGGSRTAVWLAQAA
jgi:hypothetical protein